MAFIQNPEELEQQDQQQQQNQLVGGGSNIVSGTGGSNAAQPAGRGGTSGGWVNLQNYFNANQGDTGSAQALDKQVSGQFDQERNKFQGDSSAFLQDAQGQVDKAKVSNEDADKAIKSGGSMYNYGTQSTDYQDQVGKMQNALTGQYTGPRSYEYGFSNQTQEYGDALKNNSGFDKLMGSVYSKTAQRPLTSGQFELQKQLDVNNVALADKRSQLAGGYDALTGDRDKTVTDTTSALSDLEKSFRVNQNRFRDYLSGQANHYEESIGRAEADARAAYQDAYKNGKSGVGSIGLDWIRSQEGGPNPARGTRDALGIYGADLTWDQIKREQDARFTALGGRDLYLGYDPVSWGQRAGMLNNFYSQQDQQYANTADQDERFYNTIQDFLNSDTKRKEQGFNVRG
jgi:hypothetical protein